MMNWLNNFAPHRLIAETRVDYVSYKTKFTYLLIYLYKFLYTAANIKRNLKIKYARRNR